MLKNNLGIEYKISKIEYIIYEDESYEYIFTPYYDVIDLLGTDLFQGIPGLDLDLRREQYIRKDMVPVFISERSPGPNRVDLKELLAEAGMTYLNRLEWMIRTDYIYSGDYFYVIAYNPSYESNYILQTGTKSLSALQYSKELISAISHGQQIIVDGRVLVQEEKTILHTLLLDLLNSNKAMQKKNRMQGYEKAISEGRSPGRKKMPMDINQFEMIRKKYDAGKLSAEEAYTILGISRATFFRRLKEL